MSYFSNSNPPIPPHKQLRKVSKYLVTPSAKSIQCHNTSELFNFIAAGPQRADHEYWEVKTSFQYCTVIILPAFLPISKNSLINRRVLQKLWRFLRVRSRARWRLKPIYLQMNLLRCISIQSILFVMQVWDFIVLPLIYKNYLRQLFTAQSAFGDTDTQTNYCSSETVLPFTAQIRGAKSLAIVHNLSSVSHPHQDLLKQNLAFMYWHLSKQD